MTEQEIVDAARRMRENEMSFRAIGEVLNLTPPTVRRAVLKGRLGKELVKSLKLDPSPKIISDRVRRARKKAIAAEIRALAYSVLPYEVIEIEKRYSSDPI